jgi:hypothetical protein
MKKDKRIQFPLSLSPELRNDFNKFCEEKSINKSQLIEWLILQYLGNNEKNK